MNPINQIDVVQPGEVSTAKLMPTSSADRYEALVDDECIAIIRYRAEEEIAADREANGWTDEDGFAETGWCWTMTEYGARHFNADPIETWEACDTPGESMCELLDACNLMKVTEVV